MAEIAKIVLIFLIFALCMKMNLSYISDVMCCALQSEAVSDDLLFVGVKTCHKYHRDRGDLFVN